MKSNQQPRKNLPGQKRKLVEKNVELTEEQVQAALISLIAIPSQNGSEGQSRKRYRKKSLENSRKKPKIVYDQIPLSNLPQTNTIVLATSALNAQQMVRNILLLLHINSRFFFLLLETSQKIRPVI